MLKDVLVDKLRRAKEQLKIYERENNHFQEELKKYKETKEYLIARLHQADLNGIGKAKLIKDLSDEVKSLQQHNKSIEESIELAHTKEEQGRELLAKEVSYMRNNCDIAQTQKAELVSAFQELCDVFNSFGLKV